MHKHALKDALERTEFKGKAKDAAEFIAQEMQFDNTSDHKLIKNSMKTRPSVWREDVNTVYHALHVMCEANRKTASAGLAWLDELLLSVTGQMAIVKTFFEAR